MNYAVYSRFVLENLEAETMNATAAKLLVQALRAHRGELWQFRIVALTNRGKSTDWS